MRKFVALLVLASPTVSGAQEVGNRLNLVCLGAGAANRPVTAQAYAWNSDGDTAGATVIGNRSVPFDDQVNLWVEGDQGQIRMPRTMLPAIRGGKDGWFAIKSIKTTGDAIIGSVSVNPLNNPKLRIDRLTGAISLSGKAGDYSGICKKYDPATAQRAF